MPVTLAFRRSTVTAKMAAPRQMTPQLGSGTVSDDRGGGFSPYPISRRAKQKRRHDFELRDGLGADPCENENPMNKVSTN